MEGMGDGRPFLEDLALVLCVAAITTVLFRRLRQPVVLGYLLAGMIVGPHIPIPLFVDIERVHTLSELGVVLVMFSVGLEFSVRRLARVLPTAGVTGVVQICLMMSLGYLVAQALGWRSKDEKDIRRDRVDMAFGANGRRRNSPASPRKPLQLALPTRIESVQRERRRNIDMRSRSARTRHRMTVAAVRSEVRPRHHSPV